MEALTLRLATLMSTTSDLPKVVKASIVSTYADDTNIALKSQDIFQFNETINDDLKRLDLWMQLNKPSLNVSKTQSMLIRAKDVALQEVISA